MKNGFVAGKDGKQEWHKDDKLHREDGPALVESDGFREWYKDGELHRDDGPAVYYTDGRREWYKDGELHRDDGPAVIGPRVKSIHSDEPGTISLEYWLEGRQLDVIEAFTRKMFKGNKK